MRGEPIQEEGFKEERASKTYEVHQTAFGLPRGGGRAVGCSPPALPLLSQP